MSKFNNLILKEITIPSCGLCGWPHAAICKEFSCVLLPHSCVNLALKKGRTAGVTWLISSPSSHRSRKPRGPPRRCRSPRGTPAECYLASSPPARSWPCAVAAAPSGPRPPAGTLTDRRQEEDFGWGGTNKSAENREYVRLRRFLKSAWVKITSGDKRRRVKRKKIRVSQ